MCHIEYYEVGTLAVDGWAVTFGSARRGLDGLRDGIAYSEQLKLMRIGLIKLAILKFSYNISETIGDIRPVFISPVIGSRIKVFDW